MSKAFKITPDDIVYCCLPLYHAAGKLLVKSARLSPKDQGLRVPEENFDYVQISTKYYVHNECEVDQCNVNLHSPDSQLLRKQSGRRSGFDARMLCRSYQEILRSCILGRLSPIQRDHRSIHR